MAPEEEREKNPAVSKEKYDYIMNKVAVAFAKHEEIVKGWMAKSGRPLGPEKTMEQLIAEDELLFRPPPQRSGVGSPVPAKYLVKDAERNDKDLRAKFFPTKGLKASKARDTEEKAASAKRALNDQSSDEEEGRSSLGRAKKRKVKSAVPEPAGGEDVSMHTVAETETVEPKPRVQELMKNSTLEAEKHEARSSLGKKKKRKSKHTSQDSVSPAPILEGAVNQASEQSHPQELTLAFKSPSSKTRPQDDAEGPSSAHESSVMHSLKKPGDGSNGEAKDHEPEDTEMHEATELSEEMKKKALKKEKKRQKKKEKKEMRKREKSEAAGLATSD
ncbi:uncharacterized protein BP5553_02640 [Venustampulla echinocandica]|uniref:Uncharacterized protein n=1 Tax=Venustampulla echinocandica TaxID=2656787 RepID=A0A370TS01_9HELO|nr:uncharacterized protein BP5553_02640 [Venustampulla echinocandica]RDL38300.1 hypothetical protein BP5553_02640 [Venustampulla echinocandica]